MRLSQSFMIGASAPERSPADYAEMFSNRFFNMISRGVAAKMASMAAKPKAAKSKPKVAEPKPAKPTRAARLAKAEWDVQASRRKQPKRATLDAVCFGME